MAYLLVAVFVLAAPTITCITPHPEPYRSHPRSGEWKTLNLNGDVSLPPPYCGRHWSMHTVGFTDATVWRVFFEGEVKVVLKTASGERGHLAVGMWWTTGFRHGLKIPLISSTPTRIVVDFDVMIESLRLEGVDRWLRVALACAVQRGDGAVVYTEMDFWDSPNTLRHPRGNVSLGGEIVYQGGDVVEYKIDQIPLGVWRHYRVDLTEYVDRAWGIRPGDRLESVYIVIEVIENPVEIVLHLDNFWVKALIPQ
mgnify:CR=1 FL=1